jgi:hypothetical protein
VETSNYALSIYFLECENINFVKNYITTVIGLNTNPPQNIGDLSLIPILLFIISVPLIITMHLIMIRKIFSNRFTEN